MRGIKPKKEASTRNRAVLRYIVSSIDERGYPPTVREIADHFGWTSTHASTCHIVALERHGCIVRHPLASRGLKVTEKGRELVGAREVQLELGRQQRTKIVYTGLAFAAELAVEALDLVA